MKTPLLDGILKVAWGHPITQAENDAREIRARPNDPFALFEDKDPKAVKKATKEMREIAKKLLSEIEAWQRRYHDVGAGDTAVSDKVVIYINACMRTGWKDILQ